MISIPSLMQVFAITSMAAFEASSDFNSYDRKACNGSNLAGESGEESYFLPTTP